MKSEMLFSERHVRIFVNGIKGFISGTRNSTMDSTENDALLEVNRMELRSGRNLLKLAADSEVDGTSTTPKEKMQTPRRKSVNSKRNIENKTENEELVGEPQSRKSTQRKTNKRKSKLEEENEGGTSTTSKEKIQTPKRKSVNRKMSMGKGKENEEPVDESQSRKSTQREVNKRKSRLEEENEVAETSPLVENAQTPNRTLSQMKKRRKSMPILTEHEDTSTTSKENMQTPRRKSVNSKRSIGKEKENEPDVTFNAAEESPGRKSGQRKTNKRKSMLEEENEVAETSPLVGNAPSPHEKVSQSKKRRKSMHIVEEQPTITCITIEESSCKESSQTKINRRKSMNEEHEVVRACTSVEDTSGRKSSETKINRRMSKQEEEIVASELIDLVSPAQECEILSSHGIGNVEKNEVSASTGDQNEEDVAEILNSTFEVAEEDTVIQTPARKRSVRFVDAVETRRQSVSVDSSPKTPVSVNSKQRSSHYKGTPHPSAKKRPASILKNSSSKNFLSSSKDNSLRGTGSVRKMPDFGSIHKAQFEKMESIVDFSHRRHKCVRKLETQATDDSNKQVQLKPSAIVKPIEQTTRNTLSRIPVVPQNTSRSGTPRAVASSHVPLASFRVLTEKNFDARRNTPHKINSKPSLTNFDASRSTPQAINSRASSTKIVNNSRPKPVTNSKLQRVTYEQAKAAIQNKKPLTAAKRETERLENRNLLKGVRLNRRFELQMQHRKINM